MSSTAPEWPSDWRRVPLWTLFERIKDTDHPNEQMLSIYREHGVVKKDDRTDNFNKTAENRSIYQLVGPGWLAVNRMKAWQGAVGISSQRGIMSGHYICFRPRHSEESRFLNWLLRSEPYRHYYAQLSRGVRPSQFEIDNDDLRALTIYLPPVDGQRRIASFLDTETAHIEQLIAFRERQLNLLRARRRSVISQVGDELSQRHGEVKFSYLIESIQQGWSPQCDDRQVVGDEWGVVKSGCVNGGSFNEMQHKALPIGMEPRPQYLIKRGDLLMSRASGSTELIGSVAVVDDINRKLLLCDKVYRIGTQGDDIERRYLAYMLQTHINREIIKQGISGGEGMANNLPVSVVKSCLLPPAPLSTQRAVVARLDDSLKSMERLKIGIEDQIIKLRERSKTITTAAVTGQLNVATGRGADLS